METTTTTTTPTTPTPTNDIFLTCNSNPPWDTPSFFPFEHHHLLLPFDFPDPYTPHPFELQLEEEGEEEEEEEEEEKLGPMKEMMYRVAAMQPVDIDPTTVRRPRRRNVRISEDPQSVAARQRRQRISERLRILQRLVPGGTKLDTASMLDEAVRYVKFLKRQIVSLQSNSNTNSRYNNNYDNNNNNNNNMFFCSSSSSSSSSSPSLLLLQADNNIAYQ